MKKIDVINYIKETSDIKISKKDLTNWQAKKKSELVLKKANLIASSKLQSFIWKLEERLERTPMEKSIRNSYKELIKDIQIGLEEINKT